MKNIFSRAVVVAPTRSTCLNISMVLSNGAIPKTLLMQEREEEIFEAVDCLELGGFGVVAGTGTGKTVAIRDIAGRILGEKLSVDVVTREHEATDRTWQCNTLVVTPGVALNWLKSNILTSDDLLVFDEIHQTSEHLELTLALAKRVGCTFIWMSATIDPTLYSEYLNAVTVIECSAFDPSKRADVECKWTNPESFFSDERIEEFIAEERAIAVFVPTRAMAEGLSREYGQKDGLYCDFYHGGEKAEKLRQFLKGDVPKPFMVFMTIAGASSLNILGLDTVVIVDEMFKEVVHSGVPVLQKVRLGNNELLQMGGRVNGRMENSRVYILTSRDIDFHSLEPTVPEFVLGGDLRRVALTCAKLGVNASELDLISPIDSDVYGAEVERFRERGIIEVESENLTPYGRKVERLPIEPAWAELVVNAESDDSGFFNTVIISSCIESLYSLLRKNADLRGVGVSGSDHLTAYNIVVSALRNFGYIKKSKNGGGFEYSFRGDWVKKRFNKQTGQTEKSMGEFAQWCNHMNFNAKSIKEATLAMKSMYRQLGLNLPEPMELQIVSNNDYLHLSFVNLLAKVQSLDFVHGEYNSKAQSAFGTVWAAQSSMAGAQRTLGKIRHWADRRGVQRATIEGTDIPQDLVAQYATKTPKRVTKVTDEGVEIEFRAIFAGERVEPICQVVSDEEVPSEFVNEAERKFIDAFASRQLTGAEVVVDKNAEVREKSEQLWVRSGGEFQRIIQQDERELYERELLSKGIISVKTFEQALRAGRVNVKALFLSSISDSKREKVEQENPEMVEVEDQILVIDYSKNSWSDTFYAKTEVDKEFVYSTKVESIDLPSGRRVELICDGKSAMIFSELVAQLTLSDCAEELSVPKEDPWQREGSWSWSLTELGQMLKSRLEALVKEHAENPKTDNMAGRIEALKLEALKLRTELGGELAKIQEIIAEMKSSLLKLIENIEDSNLRYSLERQVVDGIEEIHKDEINAVEIACQELTSAIEGSVAKWREEEAERRRQAEENRLWAESEGLPEWMIDNAVESGDFSSLRTFVKNVDELEPNDLDEHICLNCGRDRRREHFAHISGLDAYNFFQGFDPNNVVVWIWDRLSSRRSSTKRVKKEHKSVASVGESEEGFNNPFAVLASLKK